jgi:hypothetical protein
LIRVLKREKRFCDCHVVILNSNNVGIVPGVY